MLASAAVALISFTLIASAVYLVNDVCDQERDRLHPRKRLRPIASGRLPRSWAIRGAACAVAAGFGLAAATHQGELAWVLAGYLGISLAYSVWLKNLPVVELLIVAYGFVWRPVAGAEATGIAASGWFLAVCCFAALAVAIGKRYSEITRLDNAATQHRRSLRAYRPAALRVARRVASLATVACYCGWAVSRRAGLPMTVALVSALPLAAALDRYGGCNERGLGGAPEDLIADRPLQIAGVVWLALFSSISHV